MQGIFILAAINQQPLIFKRSDKNRRSFAENSGPNFEPVGGDEVVGLTVGGEERVLMLIKL